MATIVTRAGKGSPLTNNEVDANFNNLNTAVIASANYTASGTGATSITVQSKLNQVVNVKDYGATGDGTTNDTTAIQNAINASVGIIYFPAGTYSVTSLTLTAGKQLRGENRETAIIRLRTALSGSGMINATNASNIVVDSFTIDGNSLAGSKDSLLNFYGCHGARIENNNFANVDQFALGCNSMNYWVASNNKFLMTQRVGAWIDTSTVVVGSGGPANTTGLVGTISAPTGSNPIQAAFTYSTNASGSVIASSIVFSTNGRGYITNPTASFPAVSGASCTGRYGGAQVVAITGSASALVGEGVEISHNYFEGGGVNCAVQGSNIFNNISRYVLYGAPFVSEQATNVGRNSYYNNTVVQTGYCVLAGTPYVNTYIGADTDNTVGSGFELWGYYENCHDNIVYYNASNGISFGSRGGICANNTVYDNGQYYASIGNYNTYGIKAAAGNSTYNGSYSVIQGNRSFDQNGISGKQGYGIGAENSTLVGLKIVDNDASGNRTSDYNMNSSTPSVLRDILSTGGGGGGGTVTGVTATAPVVSSGGTAPVISMAAATTSANGYLTSTDWNTFNNKQPATFTPATINTVTGVSSTLATTYSNRKVVEAQDYGVVVGSSGSAASNSTIINNLMAGLSARGGGILQLPPGDIYIASTLDNKYPRVQVWGVGTENFHDSGSPTFGTRLIATTATTMLKLRTPYAAEQGIAASSTWKYTGGGFKFLALNGGAVATKALLIDSVSFVDVDVWATNFNSTEFYTIQCGVSATNLGEACDVQFSKIVLRARAIDTAADKAATICRLLGSSNANVSLNRLPEYGISVYAQHWNGNVLTADSADNNDISLVGVRAGGTGYLAYMKGPTSSIPTGGDSNNLYYVSGGGAIYAEGTNISGVISGVKNRITNYDNGNGTPEPTAGTGSTWAFTRVTDNVHANEPASKLAIADYPSDAGSTLAAMGSESLRVRNASSNHVRLTDTTNEWGINIDGTNGNLRFNRVAGTGTVSFGGIALPPASGGTGLTAPGASGNVLTSNGTGWVSSTPSGGGGGVSSVTGTAPVVSSGGTTPAISMAAATASADGYLTSTDWTTFNGKQSSGAAASFTSLAYSTTLTGGTGIVNIGSGQIYKDVNGYVGIGNTSPSGLAKFVVFHSTAGATGHFENSAAGYSTLVMRATSTTGYSGLSLSSWSTWTTAKSVGQIRFDGLTSTGSYTEYAGIYADAGTNTSTGAPTSLFFTTSAGAGSLERMRIDASGSVGVGTTAVASSILDVQSTTKGVRFPNMTTTQKNAISSPALGLVVFDTTLAKLCVYTGAWQTITSV